MFVALLTIICLICYAYDEILLLILQSSSSLPSISSDGGFKGSSEYSQSQLEASAAQKESFFNRKMQVQHLISFHLYSFPSPGQPQSLQFNIS